MTPWRWLILPVLFAFAYTQAPLYTSNQNVHCLRGLARAGRGLLSQDSLASSADPYPVFTLAVSWAIRHNMEWVLYATHGALCAIYLASLLAITQTLNPRLSGDRLLLLGAALTALHSRAAAEASRRITGVTLTWHLQSGLAGQYLLGPVLQPSAFGVLLLASIALRLRGRTAIALLVLTAAAAINFGYLLSCVCLAACYFWDDDYPFQGLLSRPSAATFGALLLLPGVLYVLTTFAPSSPGASAQAARILFEFRIPHHADIRSWFNIASIGQLLVIAAGFASARGTSLAKLMAAPAAVGLALTAVQLAMGSRVLALLFPWRVSTFLVPISLALILARVAALAPAAATQPFLSCTLAAALGAAGLASMRADLRARETAPWHGAAEFAARHRSPGQLYVIPVRLEDFRIEAGVPVIADYKSHPFKDFEVLAWHERYRAAEDFEREPDCSGAKSLATRYGATHWLVARGHLKSCANLVKAYEDPLYEILRQNRSK